LTREAWSFQRALLASLALHGVLIVAFMTLPGGGPSEPVRVYTVRIVEAPPRPEARALALSTEAISALRLESPTLRPDAPPLPALESPDVPAVERFPQAPASPGAGPPAAPGASTATAPSLTPPAPESPRGPPAPRPPPGTPTVGAPPALPSLPAAPPLPPTAPPATPRSAGQAAQPPSASAPTPPALTDEPARPSAMEQLRGRVQTLDLQVDSEPPAQASGTSAPARERNVLSLRVYTNRVREAVKEQYTFPGTFDGALRARLRVVLNRDGSVRGTELLESSGNARFDRLVCLAAFNRARIPAIPRDLEIDGDSLTLTFTCSP
jgi:TonB family protein